MKGRKKEENRRKTGGSDTGETDEMRGAGVEYALRRIDENGTVQTGVAKRMDKSKQERRLETNSSRDSKIKMNKQKKKKIFDKHPSQNYSDFNFFV